MRLLIFFLFTFSFIGCKETQCPAFPPSLIEYFPYSIGDEMKFTNIDNDNTPL